MPLAFGDADSFLESSGVRTSDGVLHPSGIPSIGVSSPKLPVAGGFLVALNNASSLCDLYRLALDGTAVVVGSYTTRCWDGAKLDASGSMTALGRVGMDDTIDEIRPGASAVTIYTEANRTPDNFALNPPRVFLSIHLWGPADPHSSSALVSGN